VKSIALTFDDGPTPSTRDLLRVLAEYDVKATFFECGAQVRRHPDISRAVAEAGHEIGNHSDSHPLLAFRARAFIRDELARAQQSIASAAGEEPKWFRAPYGVRWLGLRQAQRELGLTGVMWTVIGRDWTLDDEGVARRLLARAENGAIFCLHDGRGLAPDPDISVTLKAVRRIVPVLLGQGFRFATITELLCPQNSSTA